MTGFLRKRCGICKYFDYDLDSNQTMINQKCSYKNEKVFNRDDCCEDFEISQYGNGLLALHDAILVDNDFGIIENDSTNSGNEKRFRVKKQTFDGYCIVDSHFDEYYAYEKQDLEKLCENLNHLNDENEQLKSDVYDWKASAEDYLKLGKSLKKENEQLKNKIDVLEDDNETYHKSLEKLNLYTKRFIPTKCTNEFKDCKTNRYYWLDHEGNFDGCLELLNLLDCENELLKSENRQLKGKLMLYEEQMKGDLND